MCSHDTLLGPRYVGNLLCTRHKSAVVLNFSCFVSLYEKLIANQAIHKLLTTSWLFSVRSTVCCRTIRFSVGLLLICLHFISLVNFLCHV